MQSWRHLHGDPCAASKPVAVAAELQPELLVVDPQVTVAAAGHGFQHHTFHFLRDDAGINLVAAEIAKAIVAEAIGEVAEQDDVVLQRDVRASSTTATTTEAASTSAAPEAASATTAPSKTGRSAAPGTHACHARLAAGRLRSGPPAR